MPSVAVWALLVMVVLQGYVAYLLLAPRPQTFARATLAALFLANALFTSLTMAEALLPGLDISVRYGVDDLTNALMVLSAEAIAVSLLGIRHRRSTWAAVLALAFLLSFGLRHVPLPGFLDTPAYTLLAYGYLTVRLGHAALASRPGSQEAVWAGWLLMAFLPRAVEFLMGFAWLPTGPTVPPVPAMHLLGLGLLVAGIGMGIVLTVRLAPAPPSLALTSAIGAGLLLGIIRFGGDTNELPVIFFSLGILRPLAVLVGIERSGLLGARLRHDQLLRHATLGTGAAAGFLLSLSAASALLVEPDPATRVLLAAAGAVVLLPLWAGLAEHVVQRAFPHKPAAPRVAPGAPASPPPGLDPTRKYDTDQLAFYEEARRRVASLPQDSLAALAALPRHDRLLLALRGSSRASLGRPEFSLAGVQLATHIPYRYLAGVVKKANATRQGQHAPSVLVESTQGIRGVRHYWLTRAGDRVAEDLAVSLGLPDPAETRYLLGEGFYPDARPGKGARRAPSRASSPEDRRSAG